MVRREGGDREIKIPKVVYPEQVAVQLDKTDS